MACLDRAQLLSRNFNAGSSDAASANCVTNKCKARGSHRLICNRPFVLKCFCSSVVRISAQLSAHVKSARSVMHDRTYIPKEGEDKLHFSRLRPKRENCNIFSLFNLMALAQSLRHATPGRWTLGRWREEHAARFDTNCRLIVRALR